MQGHFPEQALRQCEALLPKTYEFKRCVRPDGSAYGTGRKCRKGTEQPLFESDGGIQTGASGGIIGGKLFKANAPIKLETKPQPTPAAVEQPYKNLHKDLKQSIEDSKKLGFARNKKKRDALIKAANTLLERELGVMGKGHRDNAYSDLYEGLDNAFDKVLVHGDKSDIMRRIKVKEVQDKLFEEGVFWRGVLVGIILARFWRTGSRSTQEPPGAVEARARPFPWPAPQAALRRCWEPLVARAVNPTGEAGLPPFVLWRERL